MKPFWTMQTDSAKASIIQTEDSLIFENRYLRRVIDLTRGITCSITDGDGNEALAAPLREGCISVNSTEYELLGKCDVQIRVGQFTEKMILKNKTRSRY